MSEEKSGCSGCIALLFWGFVIFALVPSAVSMLSQVPEMFDEFVSGDTSHDEAYEATFEPDEEIADEGADEQPLRGTVAQDVDYLDLEQEWHVDDSEKYQYEVREGYTLIEGEWGSSQFEESFEKEVTGFNDKICVKNIPEEAEATIFSSRMYGCFWVETFSGQAVSVRWRDKEDRYVYYDIVYYDDERYMRDDMEEALEATIDQILSRVNGSTPFECALEVHDILCELVTYDKTMSLRHAHDIYGALVNHLAVCDGYSSAFAYLMLRLGYGVEVVRSENHSWNVVEGTYSDERFVDVTWDDLDTYDTYGRPYISHDYLFLTEEEMATEKDHTLLESAERTDDGSFNQRYNYHYVYGLYLDSFDVDLIAGIFQTKMNEGENYITVRFSNWDDYQRAYNFFCVGSEELDNFLRTVGYQGRYLVVWKDTLMTIGIELYPPEE